MTNNFKGHIIIPLIPPFMFIRRPDSGMTSRVDPADERILKCIEIYETADRANLDLIEKNRGAIVFDVLERNRKGKILLEVGEMDMLESDGKIPRTVLARIKKILRAKA